MKVLIVVALLSFLFNTIAQAKSSNTKGEAPPPTPPPWAQITTV